MCVLYEANAAIFSAAILPYLQAKKYSGPSATRGLLRACQRSVLAGCRAAQCAFFIDPVTI